MPTFEPQDPNFEARIRASFARQKIMKTIGARLTKVAPGEVEIELPFRADLTQQHGFLHAGIVTAIVDTACGYAAMTLMPGDATVLTVEYKLNLLAPGEGDFFVAEGRVAKPGRTLCIVQGEVYARSGERRTLCALMQQTLIVLHGRPDDDSRRTK